MGSVSLGSQVATAPLRTKFACHLQAGGGKFLCTRPSSPEEACHWILSRPWAPYESSSLATSRGRKGWRRSPFFHLYPIKIAFSQKLRLPVGIFLLFRKISCIQKISGIKKDRRAGLFPFHSSQKLLIRPMLMRGRAQAFCFDESARGSRRSGMSVSSGKSRYSHSCHQDF